MQVPLYSTSPEGQAMQKVGNIKHDKQVEAQGSHLRVSMFAN